jgi:hypothetical protein
VGDFDRCNALGWRDDDEPPFTEDELADALDWRQGRGHMTVVRPDMCPHPRPCASVADCVERIAWYLRHRRAIETNIATGNVEGFAFY